MASTQRGAAALPLVASPPFGDCQQHHRRRHVGPSGQGSLARDSRDLLWRSGPAAGFASQNVRHAPCSRLWPPLPPRRFERRDHARAPASGIGKPWNSRDAGRRRRQRPGGHSLGLPANADRNLHRPESWSQGPLRERHVQFARELHSFASTKAERIAAGDPRLSIEERYPTRKPILPPSERLRAISWRSASCCRTMRTRWSRSLRAKAFGTPLRGRLHCLPVLRCGR
jgi:hypothetical protein